MVLHWTTVNTFLIKPIQRFDWITNQNCPGFSIKPDSRPTLSDTHAGSKKGIRRKKKWMSYCECHIFENNIYSHQIFLLNGLYFPEKI